MEISKMNLLNPLVTVITVTFNAEKYLESTIKSIIEQEYSNIEYIIIDGGSNDNTINIIKNFSNHIDHWISEPDRGIYDAMNKGIDKANGEWINFLNAGDTFCESKSIEKVAQYFNNNYDLISGDMYYLNDGKKEYYQSKGLDGVFDGMFCNHQTLFTRINIMKKYKFNLEFKLASDYDFVIKCFMNKYRFKFLNFAISNFLSGGFAEENPILGRIEDMFIQCKYLKNLEDIYSCNSYARFASYQKNNNRIFSKLLNNFYQQLDQLDLMNKKFVLYGFGSIGQIIYYKYKKTIIDIFDKNHIKLNKKYSMNIKAIDKLIKSEFDFVIISVFGREKEIEHYLSKELHICSHKILKITL